MTRVIPRGESSGFPAGVRSRARIGSEYLFLAETLGLPVDGFHMEIHYGPQEARFARDLIQSGGLSGGFAVICPFTTRPQKHWFEARWAELADALGSRLGLTAVMLGGRADRDAAGRIRSLAGRGLIDLTGRTSLLQAAAVIDHCALLVAVDTGLGHMGIAFGRPSLLLFGSTRPYLDTTRADARVLYHPMPCSPCRRRPTCNGDYTCMKSIEPEEVLTAACEILGVSP
jgi:heptosyltransferase-1